MSFICLILITCAVRDVNDNAPQWPEGVLQQSVDAGGHSTPRLVLRVRENNARGTQLELPVAVDADEEPSRGPGLAYRLSTAAANALAANATNAPAPVTRDVFRFSERAPSMGPGLGAPVPVPRLIIEEV